MYKFGGMIFLYFAHSLITPPLINNPTPIDLTLLQHHLIPPLLHINRINIPTRLHAEPAPRPSSLHTIYLRHVNILASIELECGFGAQNL